MTEKKIKVVLLITAVILMSSLQADPMQPHDCRNMSEQVQQFAGQLTPLNREKFCGQFTQAERASAIQMTIQPDPATGLALSPDNAVEKVDRARSPQTQQKTPTGCPIK